jgi:Ser/Thr protein kinase RdoA (MazF antagonist)
VAGDHRGGSAADEVIERDGCIHLQAPIRNNSCMDPIPFNLAAREVLAHFPQALRSDVLAALGNRGGFSGAWVWQVEGPGDPLCLRAWPPTGPPPERLRSIHQLMTRARAAGLLFVPAVLASSTGATWVQLGGRLWDLTTWQPGRADFHQRPSRARLEAACTALAHLHDAWSEAHSATGPCPAIQRRLAAVRDWQESVRSGWRPRFSPSDADPVHPWAERAWRSLPSQIDQVPGWLAPWADRHLPLQPCLCDIWHAHVLFQDDAVTGLIDYGSVKVDHVAVDLARLLGSLVGDQVDQQAAGLDGYHRRRGLSSQERALVALLDRTGTLVGVANWLMWLYRDGKTYPDRAAVAGRLATLVQRIEAW